MMLLKAIVVDDEPVARKVIREYIEDIDYLELAGMAENPLRADILLNEQQIDLIFLDINMPKLSGIEFLRTSRNLPKVIITTAYAEYALDGFEWEVMDYLVKPFSFERFLRACHKVRDHYLLARGLRPSAATVSPPSVGSGPEAGIGERSPDHFFVKCDNRLEKVRLDELMFVEAMMNYVILHTTSRKMITYLTMKGILEHLPADRFIKVHKSYIVNLSMIRSLEGNMIQMEKAEIPIGQIFYDEAVRAILKDKVIRRG